MSIAIASISLRRWSTTMKCSFTPFTGGGTRAASSPIRSIASWKKQCACESIVLMRLPFTITGSRAAGFCACAAVGKPQPQNTRPASAPAPLRKSLRVDIWLPPHFFFATCAQTLARFVSLFDNSVALSAAHAMPLYMEKNMSRQNNIAQENMAQGTDVPQSPFDFTPLLPAGLPPAAVRWPGLAKYNFTGGNNDADEVPVDDLIAAATASLKREGRNLATYNVANGPQGYRPLREFLVGKLNRDAGVACTADDI